MATTEQIVEKVFLRLQEQGSPIKQIYRFEIESFIPEALSRLYLRLNLTGNTSDFEVTSSLVLDANGISILPPSYVIEAFQTGGTGYIQFADYNTNQGMPISYEPNFESRYFKKSNPSLYYYALRTDNVDNKIYVYLGDGQATPAANATLEILGIVVPSNPAVLSTVNISRLVDILVEICREKLGTDQIPDTEPPNQPVKPNPNQM